MSDPPTQWPDESHVGLRSSVGWTPGSEPATPPEHPRYVLGERIGSGAQGWVYRAFDTHLERDIALKVLQSGSASHHRRVAQLQHPNIVPLHDAGILADGRPFITMELYRSETLADRIATRHGSALLTHALQACQAVALAHERGLVHQDLKPSNILVGRFEETQVADWGLAAPIGTPRSHFTGTRLYAGPNQLSVGPVHPRDDVWALGCLLQECVTGVHPLAGCSAADLPAKQDRIVVPDTLAPELRTLIRGCFDGSYPNAVELTRDLVRYTAGQRIARHDYTPFELSKRFLAVHREAVAVAGLATVLLGLAGLEAGRRVLASNAETRVERGRAIFAGVDQWPDHPPTPDMLERLLLARDLWPGPETTGLLIGHHRSLMLPEPSREPDGFGPCDRRVFEGGRPLCVNADEVHFADGTTVPGVGRWERHPNSEEGFFRTTAGSIWRAHPIAEGDPIVHEGEMSWLGPRHRVETPWGPWEPCGTDLSRHMVGFSGAAGFAACRDGTIVNRVRGEPERRWHDPSGVSLFQARPIAENELLLGREDGTVLRVHIEEEQPRWSHRLPIGQVTQLDRFGAWVLARGVRGAVVLDLETGSTLRWLPGSGTDALQLTDRGLERLAGGHLETWVIPEQPASRLFSKGVNTIDRSEDGRLAVGAGSDLFVVHEGRTTRLQHGLPNVIKDAYWAGMTLNTVVPIPAEGSRFTGPELTQTKRSSLGWGRAGLAVGATHYSLSYGNVLYWEGAGKGHLEDIIDLAEGPWALDIRGGVWELGEAGAVLRFREPHAVGIEASADAMILHTENGGRHVTHEGAELCSWTDGGSLSSAVGIGRIALGYADGTVRLLDEACDTVFVARLHDARVADLLLDGDTLFTASWDRTVREWPLSALPNR